MIPTLQLGGVGRIRVAAASSGGGGGAPLVEDRASSGEAFVAAHAVTLPAALAVGDLLLAVVFSAGNAALSVSSGTGWTEIADLSSGSGSPCQCAIYAKIATGSDALSVTSGGSTWKRSMSWAISGVASVASILVASTTSAGTSSPNPASVSGAPADRLWLAICGWHGLVTVSGYPSNFPDGQRTVASGASNRPGGAACELTQTGSSVDPSAFTISASPSTVMHSLGISA